MPLLGGLFHRRNNTPTVEGDYVLADDFVPPPPIYNLPTLASSSKLKLPFRRKQHLASPPAVVSLDHIASPRISSVTSDPGHDLAPPPRKSSLFGVYSNDSHHSVHSLPNEPSCHVHPDTHTRLSSSDFRTEAHLPFAPHPHKKSPGIFSWARERTKSKPSLPPSTVSSLSSSSPPADDASSFNLKSFRHVRGDSPATQPQKPPQPSPDPLLPPARPRPRGDSAASDSSQRISVAAFREAHARSRANSPVPSFRPPSTADTFRVDGNGRKRASTLSVVSGNDRPQLNKTLATTPMPSIRSGLSADESSDDSDSEEDEDEEVDSDGEPVPKPAQKQTITRRASGVHTRSDAGNSPTTTPIDQASHAQQGSPQLSTSAPPLTNQVPYIRKRASVSTSALTPSGAARRASILAAANSSSSSHIQFKPPPPRPKDDSDESTDSEDSGSEYMPLSDLLSPRRPGSSASNRSSSRPRMPAKPLIDINSLVGGPPLITPILRHEDSVRNLNMKGKERGDEKDQPFSVPAVLAFSSSTSPPISPSVSRHDAMPTNKPAIATHYRKPSNDIPALAESEGLDNDDDLMNAIRLVGSLDKAQEQSSGTAKLPNRIVPTPIREREPPTSFSVLSRPPHRHAGTAASLSLHPNTALSAQPELGARQRAPMTKTLLHSDDRSDAISVASAAHSSTSRSSSRIPPVPLIHSIPDSPSVKEDYKPGRPRSNSRASAVNDPGNRPRVPPTSGVPGTSIPQKVPSCQPTLTPQRPFASDRSVRGESPAGSSTGDSSSGRAPFTPRDGSDIGVRSKDDANDLSSALKARGHTKQSSVTFEDLPRIGRERAKMGLTDEQRTRERRRSEAKAAIELGKLVNGRGPLVRDDSDEDAKPRGRNPTINVTMENGTHGMMPGWPAWQQPMPTGMSMIPQLNNDPAYLAAHQRALLIAKQAYQMAVAQHAMRMAGEEWERSSNIGFGSGGSVYGGGSGGSVYGGGSGGSVYGGGSGGSVYGGMGGGMAPMSMMAMNMGMLTPPNQWARSSVAFPSIATSVYGGIASSQSEYGGGGGWGTRSVYGDSFGPPPPRMSGVANSGPGSAASAYGGNSRPRARTGASPPSASSRTPGKSAIRSRAAPPSSWKNGR